MEVNFPKLEEQILKKWKGEKTFEKSLERRRNSPPFVFYEGPPTANGRPGLHHVLARSFKDVIPRYKTMRGFFVHRRAGWDTHGLPVELEVEKQLGLKSKKDIEQYGVAKFNEACKKSVWQYQKEWEDLSERMGLWLDMENAYITYQTPYIESLWYIIKQFSDRGLLYKDYKVVPFCSRCGTPESAHEVAQGYEKTKDRSLYIRFPILSQKKEWKNTSILSWTTTPWTLPGNVALAVNPNMDYVCVPDPGEKNHWLVLGRENEKQLAEKGILKRGDTKEKDIFKGSEMLGLSYKPLFSVPQLKSPKSYKVYPGDFVSSKEGTGIVHTAVMYGEEDYELGKKIGLPRFHTVTEQGTFLKSLKQGLGGKYVKDQKTEELIIALLKRKGFLFKEELYEHDYPFCWRCSTPLLYYAKESWFLNIKKVKQSLILNNRKINWTPSHLKEGRMGEWLKEGKDWAFSRERYWGTPLPVWECEKCEHRELIGSLQDLRAHSVSHNTYYLLRHGNSLKQELGIASSWPEKSKLPLTQQGRKQVQRAARELKKEKIDFIVASDLLRTKETAKIIAKELRAKIVYDKLIREEDAGVFNGKPMGEKAGFFYREGETPLEHYLRRFELRPPKGENWADVQKRLYEFFKKMEKTYKGKRILLVSHALVLDLMEGLTLGMSRKEFAEHYTHRMIKPGEWRKMLFADLPYNKDMEVDLHRPFVDAIRFPCKNCKKAASKRGEPRPAGRGTMKRVKDVVDVWYDSGAMPFAQNHWLGGKLKEFPADYIVEAIDQTRGWFYTLLAVSTLLGFGPPYKNAISLGHLLDAKGEKMSKSKGNAVSPWDMAGKYGMDAVRWYFFSASRPGDPKLFSEQDLQLVLRRFLLTLWNSFVFYETYCPKPGLRSQKPGLGRSLLDKWIVSRLQSTARTMTKNMDAYDITGAARTLEHFVIEDLSLWYIRRSRRRFQNPRNKKDFQDALSTLRYVLSNVSLLAAPFIPFFSEYMYKKTGGKLQSVHHEDWPEAKAELQKEKLEQEMEQIQDLASKGLALRAKAGIKVRQPLALLKMKSAKHKIQNELLGLLKEELNVKEITIDLQLKTDIEIDTTITPGLREEGMVRELMRHIQGMRKDARYKPQELIQVRYTGDSQLISLIQRHTLFLKLNGGIKELMQGDLPKQAFDLERELRLQGQRLWLGMKKL